MNIASDHIKREFGYACNHCPQRFTEPALYHSHLTTVEHYTAAEADSRVNRAGQQR